SAGAGASAAGRSTPAGTPYRPATTTRSAPPHPAAGRSARTAAAHGSAGTGSRPARPPGSSRRTLALASPSLPGTLDPSGLAHGAEPVLVHCRLVPFPVARLVDHQRSRLVPAEQATQLGAEFTARLAVHQV